MELYICIALCLCPLVVCLILFKLFSSIRISTELIACLLGLLAVLPITFLQFVVTGAFSTGKFTSGTGALFLILKAVIFNGLIEEGFRTATMLLIPKKRLSFNNFFMATLLCGLCFGCFESVIYFLQHLQNASKNGADLIYHLIFARIFTSDLIHTFCAGLCGIFIWNCFSHKIDIMPLIFAISQHGLYNFFSSFQTNFKWFAVVVILFLAVELRIHYEKNAYETMEKK